mmetsp:Transcript_41420/g.93351  ORF Transcript_41420/g.93351 Transcript_41420/m.93351 type:complete len:203 (+) Transcript_41420:340-948(+)
MAGRHHGPRPELQSHLSHGGQDPEAARHGPLGHLARPVLGRPPQQRRGRSGAGVPGAPRGLRADQPLLGAERPRQHRVRRSGARARAADLSQPHKARPEREPHHLGGGVGGARASPRQGPQGAAAKRRSPSGRQEARRGGLPARFDWLLRAGGHGQGRGGRGHRRSTNGRRRCLEVAAGGAVGQTQLAARRAHVGRGRQGRR